MMHQPIPEPLWRPGDVWGQKAKDERPDGEDRVIVRVKLPEHRQGQPDSVKKKITKQALKDFVDRVKEAGLTKPRELEGGELDLSME